MRRYLVFRGSVPACWCSGPGRPPCRVLSQPERAWLLVVALPPRAASGVTRGRSRASWPFDTVGCGGQVGIVRVGGQLQRRSGPQTR